MLKLAQNYNTARLAKNLGKYGHAVLFRLNEQFGDLPAGTIIDPGRFPPGTKILPDTNVEENEIYAQNPYGGADDLLVKEVERITATLKIPAFTPDEITRSLYNITPPAVITEGEFAGFKVYPMRPGASISVAVLVIYRRLNSDEVKVRFAPRALLQALPPEEDQGQDVLPFEASIQAYRFDLQNAGLKPAQTGLTEYGAVFVGPAKKLDSLVAALMKEAPPETSAADDGGAGDPAAGELTDNQAVTGLSASGSETLTRTITTTATGDLVATTSGGTGDLQLRILDDTGTELATSTDNVGTAHTVTATAAPAGTYTIELVAAPSFADVSLTADEGGDGA